MTDPTGGTSSPGPRREVTDRERRADRILSEALELSPAEVAPFLDRMCEGDGALRRLVEELLASCSAPDTLLRTTGLEEAMAPPLAPGERLGAWQVVREIGRGGMGVVYLAERADGQFRQRGALKVIQGAAPPDLVARFEQERQILASLEHPGIARLIDGGLASGGRPFLVLEHVEGTTLLEHCDRRRLSLPARLGLFLEVCAAVAAAHRALVIHRDLKPANVLVTPQGQVKLLDFGIAKLAAPGGGPAATLGGAGLLTPEYASPEQLRGEPITLASDVYQLGVLLYELLTGTRPHRLGERPPAEWGRILLQEAPLAPSQAVLEAGPESAAAARRFAGRARWSRELRGDLDIIVLQALRDAPARRHPSAEHLAEDLRCHLQGRPIAARRENPLYVTGLLVRRHLLASAVAVTALVAIAATTWVHTRQLTVERDLALTATAEAVRERDRARQLGSEAREVSGFLIELFRPAELEERPIEELTARELLDRGALRLDEQLAGQPLTQARMAETIGTVYLQLRLLDDAREQLEKALALREEAHGTDHPALLPALEGLAATSLRQIRYQEAEEILQRALALAPEGAELEPLATARALLLQGNVHLVKGELPRAESAYRRALELQERELGAEHRELGATLNNLGVALGDQGKWDAARTAHRRAMEIRRQALGPEHSAVGQSLLNLGRIELARGDPAAARPLLARSLEIREARFGPEHPAVAESLRHLAHAEVALGRLAEAEPRRRRALAIQEGRLGAQHPETAQARLELADLLLRRHRLEEGLEQAEAAHAVFAATPRAAASDLLRSRALVVEARLRLGDLERALEMLVVASEPPQPATLRPSLEALISDLVRLGLEEMAERLTVLAPALDLPSSLDLD